MAGNLMSIPYTIALALAVLAATVVAGRSKGRRAALKGLLLSSPVVLVLQLYCWHEEFRSYAKSYLFSSSAYRCESYGEQAAAATVPLPSRTVFLGKQDACSPFYLAYESEDRTIRFYERKLQAWANDGTIVKFEERQREQREGNEVSVREFRIQWPSGVVATVDIRRLADSKRRMIVVRIAPGNAGSL